MKIEVPIYELERLDDLIIGNLKIIQNPQLFCFSLDAVLLANFTYLRPEEKVVDLGTGNGVIPLLLASKNKAQKIIGLEIQQPVAEMAARSVALNDLKGVIDIIQGDLKEAPTILGTGAFDVVTVNPPYRPLGVGEINLQDAHAIARHEICCTLEDVVQVGARLLKYHGRFYMVHRPDRLVDALYLLRQARLEPKKLKLIYPKAGRKPNMFLVEAMFGGRPGLEVLEPFFIYDQEGIHSKELLQIYGAALGSGEGQDG